MVSIPSALQGLSINFCSYAKIQRSETKGPEWEHLKKRESLIWEQKHEKYESIRAKIQKFESVFKSKNEEKMRAFLVF